ncbi:hypothetical protein [Kibdelosporangium phytohabitans]|uniref:hypothetical protein n=1 Tax=Kibdelosporangium phytohabitans TaxID=860235 RepID=UPI0012FC3102|nr:hypothetical protein [Kibdelosporangium phytohabitans]MBE1466199.1 hypothetical protein [Kibdelosporangium phytohabitans]
MDQEQPLATEDASTSPAKSSRKTRLSRIVLNSTISVAAVIATLFAGSFGPFQQTKSNHDVQAKQISEDKAKEVRDRRAAAYPKLLATVNKVDEALSEVTAQGCTAEAQPGAETRRHPADREQACELLVGNAVKAMFAVTEPLNEVYIVGSDRAVDAAISMVRQRPNPYADMRFLKIAREEVSASLR